MIAAGLGALAAAADWRLILIYVVAATLVFGLARMILRDGQSPAGAFRRRPFTGLFELLGDGNYGRFAFSYLLYNLGQGNFFGFLTLFVRNALQGSQEFASLCLGVAQATSAGARFGWGVVSDLMFGGRRKRLVVGIGVASVLLLAGMGIAGAGWPAAVVMLFVAGLGITVASYAGLIQKLSVEAVPHQTGSAVGYNGICTHMDTTGSFSGGWFVTAAMVGCGAFLIGLGFHEGGPRRPPSTV